jgi:hypothetical protein
MLRVSKIDTKTAKCTFSGFEIFLLTMGNPEIYLSENNHPARSSRTVRAITTAVLLTAACGYFFGTGIDLNYPQVNKN